MTVIELDYDGSQEGFDEEDFYDSENVEPITENDLNALQEQ